VADHRFDSPGSGRPCRATIASPRRSHQVDAKQRNMGAGSTTPPPQHPVPRRAREEAVRRLRMVDRTRPAVSGQWLWRAAGAHSCHQSGHQPRSVGASTDASWTNASTGIPHQSRIYRLQLHFNLWHSRSRELAGRLAHASLPANLRTEDASSALATCPQPRRVSRQNCTSVHGMTPSDCVPASRRSLIAS